MLRPLFQRAHSGAKELNEPLREALMWWKMVLQGGVVERHVWSAPTDKPALLLVDARGVPPRWDVAVAGLFACGYLHCL